MEADSFTCRIQFLNDVDPFDCNSLFLEPGRAPAPTYTFNIHLPLINQIGSIHRILGAPHRVRENRLFSL